MPPRGGVEESFEASAAYRGKQLGAVNSKFDGCFIMFEKFFEGPAPTRLSMLAPPQLKKCKELHKYAVLSVVEMHKLLLKTAKDEFVDIKRPGQVERENKVLRALNEEQKGKIEILEDINKNLTTSMV